MLMRNYGKYLDKDMDISRNFSRGVEFFLNIRENLGHLERDF